MAHDARGGVDGDDLLLDWLVAHDFDCWWTGRCRGGGPVCVGGCGTESVEEGSGLGGGEGGWGGAGVGVGIGVLYCHVCEVTGEREMWRVRSGGDRQWEFDEECVASR